MKRWILSPPDPKKVQSLCQTFGLSPLISQILINRDISAPEAVQQFLQPSLAHLPDPSQMKGMDLATSRLIKAIQNQELITIYGDYDVDGTTATAMLMDFLRQVGARVEYYIPHRIREGYSLNVEAIRKLSGRGTKVLITVDNGISALAEAQAARECGLDLIITDHHEVPPQLPQAYAILNPKQPGDTFPGKELAGVGVAYYLVIGLRRALRDAGLLQDKEPNLRDLLDLVALGTVADMAPLKGLNRILVREGLKTMSARRRTGLRALLHVAGVDDAVRADQLAFRVGPRINAVGRLEEANLGVELLLCEEEAQALALAERLDQANLARKELEDQISEAAIAQVESEGLAKKYRSLVLRGEDWHQGVIGIVASRLVEKYYLPTIVLTKDGEGLKGSARSIRALNIIEALKDCGVLLEKFGGHAYAAGLSMAKAQFENFREKFDQTVRQVLTDEDFTPCLRMDVESTLQEMGPDLLEQLERLEPFGLGNPTPLFWLRGGKVRESRIVGQNHLKMRVGQGPRSLGAIGFRLGHQQPPGGAQVELACFPEWNEWNGSKNIQLRLFGLREPQGNASRKKEA